MQFNKEAFKERLRQKAEANSELQRTKNMSQDERSHRAVDRMTQGILEDSYKLGNPKSEEQARSEAAEIARTADRKYRS